MHSYITINSLNLVNLCNEALLKITNTRRKKLDDIFNSIYQKKIKFRKLFFLHKIFPVSEKQVKKTLEYYYNAIYINSKFDDNYLTISKLLKMSQIAQEVQVSSKDFEVLI